MALATLPQEGSVFRQPIKRAQTFGDRVGARCLASDAQVAEAMCGWGHAERSLAPYEPIPVRMARPTEDGKGLSCCGGSLPLTMQQAGQSLTIFGRAVIAGITDRTFEIAPYAELLMKEAQVLGASDHLAQELPLLLEMACRQLLDLSQLITTTIPLDAEDINQGLDRLERGDAGVAPGKRSEKLNFWTLTTLQTTQLRSWTTSTR